MLPVDKLSNNLRDFGTFQVGCCILSVLSGACFVYSGLKSPSEIAQIKQIELINTNDDHLLSNDDQNNRLSKRDAFNTIGQIVRERNFLCIVFANFFRSLRVFADINFLVIMIEALISPSGLLALGSMQLSLFYQVSMSISPVRMCKFI